MEPIKEVIPRTTEAQEILDKFGYYLDDFVNFGSHVIKWETDTARSGDENLPPELLLRHPSQAEVTSVIHSSSMAEINLIKRIIA